MQQEGTRVQRKHRRALVIDNAAAKQPTVTALHGKGIGVPAGTRRHHIYVCDGGDLLGARAGNIGKAYIPLIVARLIAQTLGNIQRAIKRRTRRRTKGGSRSSLRRIGHRRMGNKRRNIAQHVIPHFIDIGINLAFERCVHGTPPSSPPGPRGIGTKRSVPQIRKIRRQRLCGSSPVVRRCPDQSPTSV